VNPFQLVCGCAETAAWDPALLTGMDQGHSIPDPELFALELVEDLLTFSVRASRSFVLSQSLPSIGSSFKESHYPFQLDFHVGKALAEFSFKVFDCVRRVRENAPLVIKVHERLGTP